MDGFNSRKLEFEKATNKQLYAIASDENVSMKDRYLAARILKERKYVHERD
ncbi:hypothetical protein BTS2_0502 [Bacillus sp. TS-2]|nr:hypothetical protein BTS2_0502 [Bacillus sp. TS-2]